EDSVMTALLQRRGYNVTRYQGKSVVFKAPEHTMYLQGKRAAVQRDSATLIGDTIQFNDSTNIVLARGDTLLLRDPSQGQDDIVALGSIRYDVDNRRGIVRNVTTSVASGQRWFVHGRIAAFKGDSTDAGKAAFYARDGWLTSCEETEPHYHFAAKEMKFISKNVMVARPAILYIADIPVLWLPFVFNDMRSGRRSGLIAPRLGFNQIFRQSAFARRTVEDLGYYFSINDYTDAQVSLDWRSDARGTTGDPGWLKFNGKMNYRWRDHFVQGTFATSYQYFRDGRTNKQYSLNHEQQFSQRTRLNANLNYVTNTQAQRFLTFNPAAALATIRSSLSFNTGRGPFSMQLGGTQTQYPGRSQVDRTFPTFSITSQPIKVGEDFTWTPNLSVNTSQSLNIDQVGDVSFRYFTTAGTGALDSIRVKRNTRNSTISFDTPIVFHGFNLRNAIRINDVLNDFPQKRTIADVNDTTKKVERVFARDFQTGIDWETGFNLPSFFQGSWNLSPSVNFQKVFSQSPLIVRTERTGGKFVAQTMRPSIGISLGPKLYHIYRGFGPVTAIRHAIEPQIQFAYTPSGDISDEFLAAMGDVRQGFLGANEQNTVSFGLATNFEAKLKSPESDTAKTTGGQDNGRKIKLLSLTFTTLSYDFVRARKSTSHIGLTNQSFDYTARSDLLPGFDFGVNYSLFQGNPASDSAKFKPYREGIRGTLSLDRSSPLVRAMGRLLGFRMEDESKRRPEEGSALDRQEDRRSGSFGNDRNMVAGRGIQGSLNQAALQIPSGQGWKMNLSYSTQRQRPPTGSNIVSLDPTVVCQQYIAIQLSYDACVRQQQTTGSVNNPFETTTRGGSFFRVPPTSNVQGGMSFHITDKWAGQWQTSYDLIRSEFASHVVSLQRALHDWDAVFAFSKSPNGNFSFNFFIALKAQPDLKFNYDRNDFPRGYTGSRSVQ
ncbi:MAG: putative LPS assembly protein LptD, partial [Gemmatimonadaceae bacterium]